MHEIPFSQPKSGQIPVSILPPQDPLAICRRKPDINHGAKASKELSDHISVTLLSSSFLSSYNYIGQTFAKFESKVILAKLLQKFQFKLLPGQTDRMEVRVTITPRDGVMCEVARRE